MLENLGNFTPGVIYDVLNKCFSDLKSKKYKDKRSREIAEKYRRYDSEFLKLIEPLIKENKDVELKDIIVENNSFDYLLIKSKLSEFMFYLLRVKNERGNLAEVSESVAKYLNNSLFK